MSGLSDEIWTRLANGRPCGESLWARRAAPDVCDRLLAALDVDGRRHLLVALDSNDVRINDTQSRGVQAMTRELSIAGHTSGWYVDLVCTDPMGHEAFQLVGAELADRLRSIDNAAESVSRVLAKWRRFWGQLPRDILSRSEQLGLFAELWFLKFWLSAVVGIRDAVTRWRGPVGARHDFEWQMRSVEVKATTSARGLIHRINGAEQLQPPEGGKLFLFSLGLREEGGATNTLPAIVAACRQVLQSDDDVLSHFELRLAQARYSPAHDEEYSKLRLRVINEALFAVRDDFPRITPERFVGGIPQGIESMSYEINLSGFERYRIAQEIVGQELI